MQSAERIGAGLNINRARMLSTTTLLRDINGVPAGNCNVIPVVSVVSFRKNPRAL